MTPHRGAALFYTRKYSGVLAGNRGLTGREVASPQRVRLVRLDGVGGLYIGLAYLATRPASLEMT